MRKYIEPEPRTIKVGPEESMEDYYRKIRKNGA